MKTKIMVMFLLLAIITGSTVLFAQKGQVTEKKEIKISEKNVYSINLYWKGMEGDSNAAKTINAKIKSDMKESADEFVKDAKSDDLSVHSVAFEFNTIDEEVTYSAPEIFSAYVHIMTYLGGAHPSCGYYDYNYYIANDKAYPLNIQNLFGGKKNALQKVIAPYLKAEKEKRIGESGVELDEELNIFNDFKSEVIDQFYMDPFGVTFIFPEYSVGPYCEGEYLIFVPWEKLETLITDKNVKKFLADPLARNNISGVIDLEDKSSVPTGAKLVQKLVWIPTGKDPKVLETKEYNLDKGQRQFEFKNTYDWRDKNDLNEYQIFTELYFDGVLAYKEEQESPITGQGWPKDTEITLEKTDNADYIRFTSKLVKAGEKDDVLVSVFEFRLLDKNDKIVKKIFIKEDFGFDLPYIFDVAVASADLNDEYHLKVLGSWAGETTCESRDYFPLSKKDCKLPEKILLYSVNK